IMRIIIIIRITVQTRDVDGACFVCRCRPASQRDVSLGRKAFHNTPLHSVRVASTTGCRMKRARIFYRT
ncbi:MAG: hypothetical protein LBD27_03180, partial [Tannerella sp.]|nr:hypothetical protein [Tannerella sp.]